MQFERKFNADKMLLNEFCLKNVRVLVIASDLQMLVIKKLYLKKKKKLLKDFVEKIPIFCEECYSDLKSEKE